MSQDEKKDLNAQEEQSHESLREKAAEEREKEAGAPKSAPATGKTKLTRRQFAAIAGVSVGALVACGALAKWGVTEKNVKSGEVAVNVTPKKMIITHRARCSGCQRCEQACTLINDGNSGCELARIKVWRNYQYGEDLDGEEGMYRNGNYTQDFCKQCLDAWCMAACPVGAIIPDPNTGARIVQEDVCIGCGTCHEACPWHMPTISKETNKSTKCVSCGRCAEQCPNGAIEFIDWKDIAVEYLKQQGKTVPPVEHAKVKA